MSEHWRYDECSVAFYHEGIETDMYKVVDTLNAAEARIAELKLLIDDLTNIRNINDIDEKWWGFVDSAREELMR